MPLPCWIRVAPLLLASAGPATPIDSAPPSPTATVATPRPKPPSITPRDGVVDGSTLRDAPAVAIAREVACPHDCRGGITELLVLGHVRTLRGPAFAQTGVVVEDRFICSGLSLGSKAKGVWLVAVDPKPEILREPMCSLRAPELFRRVDATLIVAYFFPTEAEAEAWFRDQP